MRRRPSHDEYFLEIVTVVAKRGTCARRQVGCVLVDKDNRILSTGYNGVARGAVHCTDVNCPGVSHKSGQGLDSCQAIHAEINALIQCSDIREVATAYVTTTPCISCLKALLASNCQRIVASSAYAETLEQAREMWKAAGREEIVVIAASQDLINGPSPGFRKTASAFSPGSPRSKKKVYSKNCKGTGVI